MRPITGAFYSLSGSIPRRLRRKKGFGACPEVDTFHFSRLNPSAARDVSLMMGLPKHRLRGATHISLGKENILHPLFLRHGFAPPFSRRTSLPPSSLRHGSASQGKPSERPRPRLPQSVIIAHLNLTEFLRGLHGQHRDGSPIF